jgi:hypothetical protein
MDDAVAVGDKVTEARDRLRRVLALVDGLEGLASDVDDHVGHGRSFRKK